jgi:hypothetical protein
MFFKKKNLEEITGEISSGNSNKKNFFKRIVNFGREIFLVALLSLGVTAYSGCGKNEVEETLKISVQSLSDFEDKINDDKNQIIVISDDYMDYKIVETMKVSESIDKINVAKEIFYYSNRLWDIQKQIYLGKEKEIRNNRNMPKEFFLSVLNWLYNKDSEQIISSQDNQIHSDQVTILSSLDYSLYPEKKDLDKLIVDKATDALKEIWPEENEGNNVIRYNNRVAFEREIIKKEIQPKTPEIKTNQKKVTSSTKESSKSTNVINQKLMDQDDLIQIYLNTYSQPFEGKYYEKTISIKIKETDELYCEFKFSDKKTFDSAYELFLENPKRRAKEKGYYTKSTAKLFYNQLKNRDFFSDDKKDFVIIGEDAGEKVLTKGKY